MESIHDHLILLNGIIRDHRGITDLTDRKSYHVTSRMNSTAEKRPNTIAGWEFEGKNITGLKVWLFQKTSLATGQIKKKKTFTVLLKKTDSRISTPIQRQTLSRY